MLTGHKLTLGGDQLFAENERLNAKIKGLDLTWALKILASVSGSITLQRIVESSDLPAAIKRIVQLEAAMIETDNGKIFCLACHNHAYTGERIQHRKDCLLFPRR